MWPEATREFVATGEAAWQLAQIHGWAMVWMVGFAVAQGCLTPTTGRLNTKLKRYEWASRVVSMPHAVGTAAAAAYGLSAGGVGVWDRYDERHDWWESVVRASAGYFLYDLVLVAFVLRGSTGRAGTIIHHVIALVLHWIPVCGYRGFVGPSMMGYLAELSTPFLNLRWFLLKTSGTQTTLYMANGLVLVLVFFACRLGVGMIYMPIVVYQPWFVGGDTSPSAQFLDSIGAFGRVIPVLTAAFFVLNVYWFGLLLQGAYTAVCGEANKAKKV